jgi:hypothetical protein
MYYFKLSSLLSAVVWAIPAIGDVSQPKPRIEMLEVCEAVITDQSDAGFDRFEMANPLSEIDLLTARAVRHPSHPLIAKAYSDSKSWFLCIIVADPKVQADQATELSSALSDHLQAQIDQSGDKVVVIEDDATFAPVRVSCRNEGAFTATLVSVSDEGDLRVAATDNLPKGIQNPC